MYDSNGNNSKQTYIIKPSHDCQGRGIYLINNYKEFKSQDQNVVAQTYIDNPFLIDELKFDLRLYVVLAGVNPLRVYIYEDGLARFATNPYVSASQGDITDMFTHLTNYSINKNNVNFKVSKQVDQKDDGDQDDFDQE